MQNVFHYRRQIAHLPLKIPLGTFHVPSILIEIWLLSMATKIQKSKAFELEQIGLDWDISRQSHNKILIKDQMNDSDRWVNHNLQRQRELLERQRQRRLNANLSSAVSRTISQQEQQQQQFGFSSERNAAHRSVTNIFQSSQSPVTTNSQYDSPSRTTQSRGSLYSFAGQSPSPVGVQPQIPSRSSSSQIVGNEGTFQYSQLPNPSINEPKIITVKGITPPQSRRQSDAEKQQKRIGGINGGSELRKPILNVEKLEPIGSSFNSEIDEEDRGFRGLNAQSYDYAGGGHSQRSPSSTTALASKRPSWNGDAEAEDDDGSIPTEILNEEPIESIDVAENLEQFVMDPIRKNYTLKCRITRDKHGMDKGMFPTYYLHLEKNDGRRTFLLAARKRKKTTTANYLISVDPTDLRRNGQSFIAKVRSNAMGTMFTIYDNGENPRKSSAIGEGVRRELGAVIYETNVLGLKGPRKMTIIIPGIYVDQKHNYVRPLAIRPISEKESILERFKTNRLDEMVVLNNKQPVWNEDTQSYVLNFHGRVTQASVKNFQIVHSMQVQSFDQKQRNSLSPDPNEYIIMQFGRIDCDTFTMDVRYPLSPVQAFGIAMTSFHGKLACE